MQTGISEELLEEPIFPDGTKLTMITSKSPLFDDDGEIIGIIGVSIDVTDLKKAEERERILLAEADVLKAKAAEEEKARQTAMLLAGAIAHEMRTPLMGIAAEARWLTKVMPVLLDCYQQVISSAPESIEEPISPIHLKTLPHVSDILDKTTRNAFTIIDMLMMNLKDTPMDSSLEICSINSCIREALSAYPLTDKEQTLIHWEENKDFSFKGNDLLIHHVLFNLLKNGLFYVKKSGGSGIFIRTEITDNANILSFKDTGAGIPSDILPHIFERFFSRTNHGTGIGLAFCKMVMEGLGGSIACHSVEGEFTEFKLLFPKI
jgi:signal transduction histidine kinase